MPRGTLGTWQYNYIMKNRDYKNFSKDSFFHVYNRGNNRENIFHNEQDYKAFLYRLGLGLGFDQKELLAHPLTSIGNSRVRITDSRKNQFKLHAFCLMNNHFHFLIEQCSDTPISKLLLKICTSYAMYSNRKYGRVGHIFQDQFKAVLIDSDSQLMWTSAYIHMNPVKDFLVKHPNEYNWSSYNDYVNNRNLPITNTEFLLTAFADRKNLETQTLAVELSRGTLDTL